jgi:hypothetical protein
MRDANTLQTVAYIIGLVSPLVVAYVTKRSWSSRVKTLLNTAITLLGPVIAGIVIQPGMSVGAYFRASVTAFITAFVAHIGYRKTGVTDKVQDMGNTDSNQITGSEDLTGYTRVDPANVEDGDHLDSVTEDGGNG